MLIYRVEDESGKGPYTSSNKNFVNITDMIAHHSSSYYEFPSPRDDGMRAFSSYHFCGFSCKKELFHWFRGYLDILATAGFKLCAYEANLVDCSVIFGSTRTGQIGFEKKYAIKVSEEELFGLPDNQLQNSWSDKMAALLNILTDY